LLASAAVVIYKYVYRARKKKNLLIAVVESMIAGFVIFVISGLVTLFTAWSDAGTLYVRKDNSDIKIVSTYINEGAYGGGTSPEDFHIVLRRPITSFLKIETAIDTTKINKDEWLKVAE
jgi:hypothetical protein